MKPIILPAQIDVDFVCPYGGGYRGEYEAGVIELDMRYNNYTLFVKKSPGYEEDNERIIAEIRMTRNQMIDLQKSINSFLLKAEND